MWEDKVTSKKSIFILPHITSLLRNILSVLHHHSLYKELLCLCLSFGMNVWFVTLWTSEEDWYPTLQKIKPLLKQHHEADCTTCEGKPHMHLTLWFAEPVKQRSICAWFGVPGAAVRNNMHPSTPHSVQFFKYSRYGLKADEEKVKKPKITTDTIREFWADNPKARRKDEILDSCRSHTLRFLQKSSMLTYLTPAGVIIEILDSCRSHTY